MKQSIREEEEEEEEEEWTVTVEFTCCFPISSQFSLKDYYKEFNN